MKKKRKYTVRFHNAKWEPEDEITTRNSGYAVFHLERYFKTREEANQYMVSQNGKTSRNLFICERKTLWGTNYDKLRKKRKKAKKIHIGNFRWRYDE